MALYCVPISESKKRKTLLLGYVYVMISLIILIATIFMDQRNTLIRILNTVIFINFGWVGLGKIKNAKREKSVDITTEIIRFNQPYDLHRFTEILWDDIRRIKREKNNALVFFQDSSISKMLELTGFSATQQENILQDLQNQAHQRSIELINFSGPL